MYRPRISTYWSVWRILAENELQRAFINRYTNLFFLVGKLLRFGMSLLFLLIIKRTIPYFAGYTSDQMIVFYLAYQFIDVTSQIMYRGVYNFGTKVKTGEFDFLLTKPINVLFQTLIGEPDLNDALFLLPNILITGYLLITLDLSITLASALWFIILLVNSFLIATALHILVVVTGILTTEVDGVVWMMRDLNGLGRFPVTIYAEWLRTLLFFIVPVGVMLTVPAQVLLGLPPTLSVAMALVLGVSFFGVSLSLWNWSLRRYSSASS